MIDPVKAIVHWLKTHTEGEWVQAAQIKLRGSPQRAGRLLVEAQKLGLVEFKPGATEFEPGWWRLKE